MKGAIATTCAPFAHKRRIGTLAVLAAALISVTFLLWRFDPRDFHMPVCTFYATTGLYCPGCGATRATHDLLHGHFLSALRHNAFWIGILPVAVYQVVSEALRLIRGYRLKHDLASRPGVLIALAVLGVLFAVLRNVPSHPWTLLSPP